MPRAKLPIRTGLMPWTTSSKVQDASSRLLSSFGCRMSHTVHSRSTTHDGAMGWGVTLPFLPIIYFGYSRASLALSGPVITSGDVERRTHRDAEHVRIGVLITESLLSVRRPFFRDRVIIHVRGRRAYHDASCIDVSVAVCWPPDR